MAYATVADATTIYSLAYITPICDRDIDGTLDTASFEMHLDIATDQIDSYLLGRYPLPLATPPAIFKKLCVDIACYNAAPTQDVLSTEMKDRAKAATDWLELVAANRIKLKIDVDTTTANLSVAPSVSPAKTSTHLTGAREFTTQNLRRIL